MRFALRSWSSILASLLLVAGCETSGGDGVPSIELTADPEVCDVPCQVVFDSGVDSRSGDGVTFTWDPGDGAIEGDARLLHTFDTTGTHEVTLTVKRGGASTADTITVLAEPQPKTSGKVDASGGSVTHGACTVTVPEGIAPEAFSMEVTELPSMAKAAERILGAERFTALGNAFDIDTPAKSSVAFDLAVNEPGAAGVNPSDLAWLVRLLSKPVPTPETEEPPASLAPLANYVLMPVTAVDADGTVHGDIYGRYRAQLVRLSTPLDVATESDATAAVVSKAFSTPLTIVLTLDAPTKLSKQQYFDAIVAGVKQAHEELVNKRQFLWPHSSLTVHVKKVDATTLGYVPLHDYNTIHLNNQIKSTDHVKKTIAHEFFHLIQHWNSNWQSTHGSSVQDAWFIEGSASWAMDEAFDSVQDLYYATRRGRFDRSLVSYESKEFPFDVYQNVGFFKWAETQQNELVRAMLEHRYVTTHKLLAGLPIIIENAVITDYLTSFKTLWSDADFLSYAYAAIYEKDFDETEDRDYELWTDVAHGDQIGLGVAHDVFPTLTVGLLSGLGDSENTAVEPEVRTMPHLSAEVLEIQTADLSGTLHVQFPEFTEPLDARVFVIDANSKEVEDSFTVRDLSKKREDVRAPMSPLKTAYVLLVDPTWAYPFATPTKGKLKVWIEDVCGPLPSNLIEASNEDELFAALTSAPPGSAVKLPAGTMSPPIREWPLPEEERVGTWDTQVLVRHVTLAGEGRDETTLRMLGNEFGSVGLTTVGQVTLRDLTIDAGAFWGVTAIDAKGLTLCNVAITTHGADAIQFSQWPDSGNGTIGIYDSSITYEGSTERHSGMSLYCLDEAGDISAEIRNSQFANWYVAVDYTNYSSQSCRVSLSTDCRGFNNNELANVMRTDCTPPDCTNWVEECP